MSVQFTVYKQIDNLGIIFLQSETTSIGFNLSQSPVEDDETLPKDIEIIVGYNYFRIHDFRHIQQWIDQMDRPFEAFVKW